MDGFITKDGRFIPVQIANLGEANTYQAEKKLYCPCQKGLAGQRRICFLAVSHQLGEQLCEHWQGG